MSEFDLIIFGMPTTNATGSGTPNIYFAASSGTQHRCRHPDYSLGQVKIPMKERLEQINSHALASILPQYSLNFW